MKKENEPKGTCGRIEAPHSNRPGGSPWLRRSISHKGRKLQHLTIEKRAQIEILLRMKLPKSQIARMVGIARSTLYNELARGSVVQLDSELRQYTRYFSDAGQRVYEEHRQHKQLYGMSIEERPEAVNNREEFGHWEIDTVVGNKNSSAVLLTLDERTLNFRHMIKIPSRSSASVEQGIQQLRATYGECFNAVFRSITSDNGSEFASLPQILPDTPIYYAHPYSSYERGLNEKQNSLIRRFFPKGHSLEDVSPDVVQRVQDWCNRFPRKAFGFASPAELFLTVLFDIAILNFFVKSGLAPL